MPLAPQITNTPTTIVPITFAISGVSYTSSTATYSVAGHTFNIGDVIIVSDVAPAGYNGTFTVASVVAGSTVTVSNATNTPVTVSTGTAWQAPTDFTVSDNGVVFITDTTDPAGITTFRQGTTPTAIEIGDLWYDTSNGNRESRWDGSSWVLVQDTSIATALANASTSLTLAGTKNTAFYSSSAPTANAVNDIWFDSSNGNKLMTWNGSAWVSVQDTAIATAQSAATAASGAATAAQTTANGKNTIYRQGATPTGGTYVVGDMWFNTSNDNAIATWNGSAWGSNSLGSNAIAYLSANKLTAGTIDASVINVSNINAGNISTGYIAAGRIAASTITASMLVAGTLQASNITAGILTSSVIYTGTIAATQVVAGNLVGFDINNGSGTFHVDSLGNLTATSATITGTIYATAGSFTGTVTTGNLTATGGTIGGITINGSSGIKIGTNFQVDATGAIAGLSIISASWIQSSSYITATGNLNANSLFYNAGHATTTSAANVFMNASSGLIALVTSSLRYKVEVMPEIIPTESIMALVPKTWIDKAQFVENGNSSEGLHRIIGLIAEDLAELPVLKDVLVNYNEEGLADSVNYDRIAITLIPLIQEMNRTIQDLTTRVEELERGK